MEVLSNIQRTPLPNTMECAIVYIDVIGKLSYRCLICNKDTIKTDLFIKHLQQHYCNLPFHCHICNASVMSFDLLINHVKENSCSGQGSHENFHRPTNFETITTSYESSDLDDEVGNIKNNSIDDPETADSNEELKCITIDDDSNDVFKDLLLLKNQTVTENVVSSEISENNQTIQNVATKRLKFKCTQCSASFNSKPDFFTHYDEHMQERYHKSRLAPPNQSRATTIQKKLRLPMPKPPLVRVKKHPCTVCGKFFTEKSNLKQHMRIHTGEKPFKCPICKKAFTQSSYIRLHMYIHKDEKPYQCNICGITYRVPSRLTSHMLRHTNTRPHKCDVCDKRFYCSGQLKDHARIHTDERPFECPNCDKKFRRRDTLKQHAKLHTGEKPYKCKICFAVFAQLPGLHNHMKSHQES